MCKDVIATKIPDQRDRSASVSPARKPASRELMVDHPREDDSLPEVAALVKSRRPLHAGVVDGLVLVDLADTDPKLLARYMGKPGAERVLAQWRVAVHGVECGDDAPR